MLLFNALSGGKRISYAIFQNISCYCLTFDLGLDEPTVTIFQNISCYCLTNEKSLFLNRFFTKKNDFISFFNIFTTPPLLILTFLEKQRILAVFTTFSKNHLVKYQKLHFPMFLDTFYYESNQSNMQP